MNIFSECLANVSCARAEIGFPKRILIALSGGADSVALFCVLRELAAQENFEIAAVHVNHGLRQTAQRDEMYCRDLCLQSHVPFFVRQICLSGRSEDEARTLRYSAFAQVYEQWQADALALAHHQADQAETVLLHLLRGSGSRGLAGMKQYSEHMSNKTKLCLFRPLLNTSKDALIHIAQCIAGGYCQDETNRADVYTRNFLRLNILPDIKTRFPHAEQALCRTAHILQTENMYWDQLVHSFMLSNACLLPPLRFLDTVPFIQQHPAVRRRIMQQFIPFSEPYDTIIPAANIQPGQRINLQKGWHLKASESRIYLLPPSYPLPEPATLSQMPYTGNTGDGVHCQAMPLKLYQDCVVRYRQPSDYITPFGMNGTKSLQDYLVDKKIDAPLRDFLPLLCKDKEVIWVIGVGASEKARCNGIPSDLVFIQYTARLPYEKC